MQSRCTDFTWPIAFYPCDVSCPFCVHHIIHEQFSHWWEIPDSDSWRLKHFKAQHLCWTLFGSFTSIGHTHTVPENKKFLHLLYLRSTEESAIHPLCCDSYPESPIICQEVFQTLLTLFTGTPCFHLFAQPLLPHFLSPHKTFLRLSLRPPVWAHYSANYSGDTQTTRKPHIINSSFLNHKLKIEMQGKIRDTDMNK